MGDLLALIALLALGPPLVFSAPAIVARILRPPWTRAALAATVGPLAGIIALQALNGLAGPLALSVAVSAGTGALWAYLRFEVARTFALVLSVATVLVPVLLVLDGDVRKSAARQDAMVEIGADTGARAPIIVVIFDEWSLTSILDEDGAIDRERLPNLAALADRATWYPNATAPADATELSIPAILSGSQPVRGRLPTVTEHPTNLFTLLAASHDLHVVEPITSLCPPRLNLLDSGRPPTGERLSLLVSDLSLVWLALTAPSPWRDRLPPVTHAWSGFGRSRASEQGSPLTDEPLARAAFHLGRTDRAQTFRQFVGEIEPSPERPGLYLLHSLLPHAPWEYLPSGKRYEGPWGDVHGLEREFWTEESPWPALHHRKRYLLQVEFVDHLIGDLIARLESTGIFEQSVVVITADHGVAFQPGRSRRFLVPSDLDGGQPLDLASVPLVIKEPFQRSPRVDVTPISLQQLVPRILEVAGSTADSALSAQRTPEQPEFLGQSGGRVRIDDRAAWRRSRLARQAELLGKSNDPMAIGVRPELHGRSVAALPIQTSGSEIEIKDSWSWDHVDTDQPAVPALVQGVFKGRNAPNDSEIAVALNGIIATTVQPHVDPDGSMRFTALLPEAGLVAGLNHVDVFLTSDNDGVALERVRRVRYPVYTATRNRRGHVVALVRRPRSAQDDPPAPIAVGRPDPGGLFGHLDGSSQPGPTLKGWAVDRADPNGIEHVVVYVAGRQIWAGPADLNRPDVASHVGATHQKSGFRFRLPPAVPGGQRPGGRESLTDIVHREGVVAYAISRRPAATRLSFSYLPVERGRRGMETIPVTDGRRLAVQPPGGGFDGSIDLLTEEGENSIIEGWAADIERSERPRQIVIYKDGKFLVNLGVNRNRPDVAARFNDDRLLRTGFRGRVPGVSDPLTFSRRFRVFAVMLSGVAVELPTNLPLPEAGASPVKAERDQGE